MDSLVAIPTRTGQNRPSRERAVAVCGARPSSRGVRWIEHDYSYIANSQDSRSARRYVSGAGLARIWNSTRKGHRIADGKPLEIRELARNQNGRERLLPVEQHAAESRSGAVIRMIRFLLLRICLRRPTWEE